MFRSKGDSMGQPGCQLGVPNTAGKIGIQPCLHPPPPHPFPSDVSERGSVTSGSPLLRPRGYFGC